MTVNLIDDIHEVTAIPRNSILNLFNKMRLIVVHSVLNSLNNGESECLINLEFGKLHIFIDDDFISYKFEPATSLENDILEALQTSESPLIKAAETSLIKKITLAYKDLL